MQAYTAENADIVERFVFTGTAGYSEFWRRNKSTVEIYEMAQLLGSLRKVASYVGNNVGRVIWSGMQAGANTIDLDPAMALGTYPIPADKTDRIVGHTIRKAYHKTEWSDRLGSLALTRAKLPVVYEYKFQLFYSMCEKVYLDCLANRSPLGHYTEVDRKLAISGALLDAAQPPTISELLHLWWEMATDRRGRKHKRAYRDTSVRGLSQRTSLEKYYTEPLELLNSIVDRLNHECPKIQGVTERVNYRLDLYFSIWAQLFDYIKYWATDSEDPYLQNSRQSSISKALGEDGEKKEDAPAWFPEDVEKIITQKSRELTSRIKEVVQNKEDVIEVKENNLVMPGRRCIRKKLLHDLKFVIKAIAQRTTTFNRGLTTGKIDRRRLYRATTTGTIFQSTNSRFQLTHDIALLVDATGSMAAPNKWEKAEEIYQTLFTAIHEYNSKARLFAYNEMKNVCRITELYLNDRFYSILPHGKTASGEALIAMTQYYKSRRRRLTIIHLTDGASNWGCGVEEAINRCQHEGINLLTLGMGCDEDNKTMLREEYHSLVQFVDSVDALPDLLRNLLNKSKWT